MTPEGQEITVHSESFDHRGGPVFYASLPGGGEVRKGCGANGTVDRNRLISILVDHVAAMENPSRQYRQLGDSAALPIHVAHGPLGRPHLMVGENRGPAISFCEGGGRIWAALCGDASDIGIDAAGRDEFQGAYPLHRVFHDEELHHALSLTGGDVADASALLWSIKEAVVKALGCGFHLVDPRQVHISPTAEGDGEYIFPVCLSGKALERYPRFAVGAGRFIWVRSFPRERMWLSIALLSRQSR
jgi:phosphopantetheinyl transferase (holo-ACP synthase)